MKWRNGLLLTALGFLIGAPIIAAPLDVPVIADFGGAPPDTPVAGLDQFQNGFRARSGPKADVLGTKRIVVMRVYFHDYPNTSRFTQAQVQGFFDNQLNTLWQHSSYGKISISAQTTALYQLPQNRSYYITDHSDGDTSDGDQYGHVLLDAIAASPNTIDWTNIDAVMVVMAETDPTQFHRGQGGTCDLPMGPGGGSKHVGCAIFSENPSDSEAAVYGRWSHEMGHAFQQGGPAHPSNYDSPFEQMDANYPGQTGVFEKQDSIAFPGWMPAAKYQVFNPPGGGGIGNIWAEEYDPTGRPNIQAIRANITGSLYYLISVRRKILGDDLNAFYSPAGIPDEGVLIERVTEGASKWVTIVGNGSRDTLWHDGGQYSNPADGIYIVIRKIDDDDYAVTVRYNGDFSHQPDIMINPWTSPPGNTWETTDIWIDSPVNGYGTYRYGTWSDLAGGTVPVGNGDDPAIGQINRFYVRVRNVGYATATNIVVHIERTDPPGLGINGASGWVPINGTVANSQITSADFPSLASLAPGATTDVYLNWKPNFTLTPEQQAAGVFGFHTCVRVKMDHVPGETVFDNQDGDREQENIDYFQAVPAGTPVSKNIIRLHNDDKVNKKWFYLNYVSGLPPAWGLDVNGGNLALLLNPDEVREVPVTIVPMGPAVVGSSFGVDVSASWFKNLVSSNPAEGQHLEFRPLGGIRVESHVMAPSSIVCQAVQQQPRLVFVSGKLTGIQGFYDPANPPVVMVEAMDVDRHYLTDTARLLTVNADGTFSGYINGDVNVWCPYEAVCLFAGTDKVASCYHIDVIQNVSPPTPGDMDGDCQLTMNDIYMMMRIVGGLEVGYPGQVAAGDVDRDGRLDIVDVAYFLRAMRVRRSGTVTLNASNIYYPGSPYGTYGVVIDDPLLNGHPDARFLACHQFIRAYNGPLGVYYWAGHWVIFNEDNSVMQLGEKFNYYFGEKVHQVDKTAATSTAAWRVTLSDPGLNANYGADPLAIHDWLAAYNNSPLSVWQNPTTTNWEAYNDSFSTIADGERFFFTDASGSGGRVYHSTSNDYFNYGVYLDDSRLNGNPNALVLAQHSYQSSTNPAPMGVWYDVFNAKWVAYNEGPNHPVLPMNEVVNYLIAQP
ncbi:MAG TPA: hypothetical protein VGM51_05470 [Armatimonadota bacterium]|jgi:hypothetical protein